MYVFTGAGAASNYVRLYGFHTEVTGGALTDGGSVINDGSVLTFNSVPTIGAVVTKNTNVVPTLWATNSNFTTLTLHAATAGAVTNSFLTTINDSGPSQVSFIGNRSTSGALFTNKIVSPIGGSGAVTTITQNLGNPVGAPVYTNNLQVRAVDSTGQSQPFFNAHDASDNTNIYYQSGKVLNFTNTAGTSPSVTKMSLNDSGLTVGTGTPLSLYRRIAVSLTPGIVAANTCAFQIFTVTGLAAADLLIGINKPTEQAGLGVTPGHVTGANTATLNFCNNTAA
jgi:hypothetical protein